MSRLHSADYHTGTLGSSLEGSLAKRTFLIPAYLLFWALHVPLGLLAVLSPQLVTLHALATLAVGVWFAITKAPLDRTIYVAVYITGAEAFWRAAGANVFWEYGKYATVLLLVLASFRLRPLRIPRALLMYFVFLLPAIVPTLGQLPLSHAREQISFNLSGHLALFVATVFFSNFTISEKTLKNILMILIAPVVAMATLALHGILTSEITWSVGSNFAASGGFGPNQVSTALSSGALAALLLLWMFDFSVARQSILVGIALWFTAQGLLTFSRGGIVILAGSVGGVALTMLLSRDRTRRLRVSITIALLSLVLLLLLYPWLNDLTERTLAVRFTDTSLTGRDTIAQASWRVFEEHPLTGVGVGLAPDYIAPLYGQRVAAHTEFARLLAEHGLLGVLSLVLFASAYLRRLDQVFSVPLLRYLSLAWFIWSVGYVLGNAMRTVAPSFFLSLTFVSLVSGPDLSED